jgi:hypothetical protein
MPTGPFPLSKVSRALNGLPEEELPWDDRDAEAMCLFQNDEPVNFYASFHFAARLSIDVEAAAVASRVARTGLSSNGGVNRKKTARDNALRRYQVSAETGITWRSVSFIQGANVL